MDKIDSQIRPKQHKISSLSLFFPSLPLEVGQLFRIQLGGLGERCKLPSGVWGGAPAEIECGAFSLKIYSSCSLCSSIDYMSCSEKSLITLVGAEN